MSFFKKLFGGDKPVPNQYNLPWIEAVDNPWNKRLLDLRPVTQDMISTSQDPLMASNAVSYGQEDGTVFWEQKPYVTKTISANSSFATDGPLQPGVLFIPNTMEHKWAIYFDGENLIFVRSWLRTVLATAKTRQADNTLHIESLTGEFGSLQEAAFSDDFSRAILHFLLVGYCNKEIVPAPLPAELENDLTKAGLFAFSLYGNMAHMGVFEYGLFPKAKKPLRTHSLLHIAVARSNAEQIEQLLHQGAAINALAGDGLAPLHWSIAAEGIESIKILLQHRADPNVKSTEGATPLMNAVQKNKVNHLNLLLQAGALVNAQDNRGFTSLHRAAEMNLTEVVQILLSKGADKSLVAEGHTALSLAQTRKAETVIELLLD